MARKKAEDVALYARLLTEMAGGGPASPRLDNIERDIIRDPSLCLIALSQFADLPLGLEDRLAEGYGMLVSAWLEFLRYKSDANDPKAKAAIAEFQARLASLARDGEIDPETFMAVTMMLGQAKIEASPEVQSATAECATLMAEEFDDDDGDDDMLGDGAAGSIETALAELAGAARQDPFGFVGMLAEIAHAMPPVVKATMANALAKNADSATAGLLLLLDPVPEVREAAADGLAETIGNLDEIGLRRLITLRNWVPEAERVRVDGMIQSARIAGVACANWPKSRLESIHTSSLDGSGTQGFLIVTKQGRKRSLSSVLTRHGVKDAWSAPQTKTEIDEALTMGRRESGLALATKAYLDRAVCHHLAVGLGDGGPPPAGLLEIAEAIGAADWKPRRCNWRTELDALDAELPDRAKAAKHRDEVLNLSEFWSMEDGMADSWFEDESEVAAALGRRKPDQRGEKAVESVIDRVIEPKREKWAEHFTWVALRLFHAPKPDGNWQSFAILARALAEGRPMTDIPLMRAIAARSIDAALA